MSSALIRALTSWFLEHKRSFPWRDHPTPYAVLVSEVMLQQTQASVVLPYFERWMERLPTVQALAAAPAELPLKLWEGLGYYSRVRRLHAAAQKVCALYGGEIPSTREELQTLPGLGSYTLGALLTFGFHRPEPAVDGNVLRVAARLLLIEEEIETSLVRAQVSEWVRALLEEGKPWITMEALIELGATVCKKKPLCSMCPVRRHCGAYREQKTHVLPKRRPSRVTLLERKVALIFFKEEVLVRRVPPGEVMADLYEFPLIDQVKGRLQPMLQELAPVTHTFTRYRATLTPALFTAQERLSIPGLAWHPLERALELPFSSGHRKILHALFKLREVN